MANHINETKQILMDILADIPDLDMCDAVSTILFDENITQIDWEKATAVLYNYLPEMYGKGFTETITYQQLSDQMDDEGNTDEGEFLDWLYFYGTRGEKDPNTTLNYSKAVTVIYDYFRERFTDDDDSSNLAAATKTVRDTFKANTFY